MQCTRCGAEVAEGSASCPVCGQQVGAAAPPPYGAAPGPSQAQQPEAERPTAEQPTAEQTRAEPPTARPAQYRSVREQFDDWQRRLPAPLTGVPIELLAVGALIVASAIWLVIRSALDIDDAITYMSDYGEPGFGLLILGHLLFMIGFAVWLAYLTWLMIQRDALARQIALVPLIGYGFAVLFADATDSATYLGTMLMLWIAAAGLLALPVIRGFVGAGNTPATFVNAGAGVFRAFAVGAGFMGLIYAVSWILMKIDDDEPPVRYIVIGVLIVLVAVAVWFMLPRLIGGDPMAQLAVTGLTVAYMVLMAILQGKDVSLLILLFLAVGACVYLWLPPAARAHFGVGQRRPAAAGTQAPPRTD